MNVSKKYFIELLCYTILYFIWINYIDFTKKNIYFKIFCLICFIVSFYALLQHLGLINNDYEVKMRSISTLGNPCYLGGFIAILLPFFLYFFITGRKLWLNENGKNCKNVLLKTDTYIFYIIWIICISMLFLTYTRGAWIAFIASYACVLFIEWKKIIKFHKMKIMVITLIILFSLITALIYDSLKDKKHEWYTLNNRISSFKNIGELYSSRLFLWKAAYHIFKDHIFVGSGPGTFSYAYLKYRNFEPTSRRFANEFMGSCHNEFLEIASSSGLFAFLSFLILIGCVVFQNLKLIRSTEDDNKTAWVCIFASQIAYIVHIFFLFPVISYEIFWWFLLAMNTADYSNLLYNKTTAFNYETKPVINRRQSKDKNILTLHTIIIIALISALTIVLLTFSIRVALGNYYLNYAKKSEAEKRLKQTRLAYNMAIENDPEEIIYYLYKARFLESLMQNSPSSDLIEETLFTYEKAINIIPVDPYPWVNLGRFCQNVAENLDKRYGLYAEKAYLKAICIDPYNYLNYNYLATLYTSFGKYEAAETYFRRSIEKYPKSAMVYYNMGILYYHKKEYQSAINCFELALKLDPHYEKAQIAIVRLYKEKALQKNN
jgi:putative inorganic carbon (HCO3(-)) transporter